MILIAPFIIFTCRNRKSSVNSSKGASTSNQSSQNSSSHVDLTKELRDKRCSIEQIQLEPSTEEQPTVKKMKMNTRVKDEDFDLRESMLVAKVVEIANSIWNCTDANEKVDKSHVFAKLDEDKNKLKAKVKCLKCSSWISICTTKYDSASMASYKRHVTSKHLVKPVRNQPTLAEVVAGSAVKGSNTGSGTNVLIDEESDEGIL